MTVWHTLAHALVTALVNSPTDGADSLQELYRRADAVTFGRSQAGDVDGWGPYEARTLAYDMDRAIGDGPTTCKERALRVVSHYVGSRNPEVFDEACLVARKMGASVPQVVDAACGLVPVNVTSWHGHDGALRLAVTPSLA